MNRNTLRSVPPGPSGPSAATTISVAGSYVSIAYTNAPPPESPPATEAAVTVINRTGESLPTPVALIGIPGGLEVRHDQLKELVEEGRIAAYEVLGREVVLYWRALEAEQRVDLPLSLVAAIPGTYTGPASRVYEYYTDEHKQWVDGMQVTITQKRQP